MHGRKDVFMKKKRIICVIVMLCMLLNMFIVYSSANNQEMDVYEYSKLIRKLTDAYIPNSFTSVEDLLEYPLNRLIVKTDSNEPLENDFGASDKIEGYNCLHILQYESESQTDTAYLNFLQSDIEYVEYDFWLTIMDSFGYCFCNENLETSVVCDCPNNESNYAFCSCLDPYAPENYFSWSSGAAQVEEAFQLIEEYGISCSSTTVAVLDTGVYATHDYFIEGEEELSRIKTDPNYTYVKDFVTYPSDEDGLYHGTHVAGIIHNNTMDNVEICSYRLYGKKELPLSCAELTGAIDAAVANGVDVINMSLRRSEYFKTEDMKTLESSIENAISNKVVLVAAAGNDSEDAKAYIPARYDDVITVSATTRNNEPDTSYSNYGLCVDIAAPGTDIYSTTPRNVPKNSDEVPDAQSLYMRISGTSMSTPLVAAAAAMIKSIDPDITPAEVKRLIKETAYVPDNWEESCGDKNYGTGIVNFYNIAKVMLEPEYSATPTISINSNNKFEITAPEGVDAKIFYTLDGTIPTLKNHLTYTAPFNLRAKNVTSVMAACYENGKLISEPAVYVLTTYDEKTVFYKWSGTLTTDADTSNAKWRSNNPDIASVDSAGNIKGVSKGDTLITCSFPSGERIIWKLTVTYSPLQAFFALFFFGFLWI